LSNFDSQGTDRFIAILLATENVSMTELRQRTGIPVSSLTRLVGRLEAAAYVRREKRVVVRTAKGEREVARGVRGMRRLGAFSDVPATSEYRNR
jgi:DNA-binding MarR family transcriptional regulator